MYNCICGKEYEKQRSLLSHQINCKEYLGEEKYNKRKEQLSLWSTAGINKNLLYDKEAYLKQWLLEQHKCKNCGKIMTEKIGRGITCSKDCRINNKPIYVKSLKDGKLYKSNITKVQLDQYRQKQQCCEICGKTLEQIKNERHSFNKLCMDHNHKTLEFRGLLCLTCNSVLGNFEKYEDKFLQYLDIKGRQYKI